MDNPKLPHLRMPQEKEEPFETMDREMAKVYRDTHPDYDRADIFGNKPPQPVVKNDDAKDTSAS